MIKETTSHRSAPESAPLEGLRPHNAMELLTIEHRRMTQLFIDYFAARSDARRFDVLPILCHAVRQHFDIEVDIFFPLLSRAAGDPRMAADAAVERETITALLDELQHPDPGGFDLSAQVRRLGGLIANHILAAERPGGYFDRSEVCGMDPDAVGHLLRRRKYERAQHRH